MPSPRLLLQQQPVLLRHYYYRQHQQYTRFLHHQWRARSLYRTSGGGSRSSAFNAASSSTTHAFPPPGFGSSAVTLPANSTSATPPPHTGSTVLGGTAVNRNTAADLSRSTSTLDAITPTTTASLPDSPRIRQTWKISRRDAASVTTRGGGIRFGGISDSMKLPSKPPVILMGPWDKLGHRPLTKRWTMKNDEAEKGESVQEEPGKTPGQGYQRHDTEQDQKAGVSGLIRYHHSVEETYNPLKLIRGSVDMDGMDQSAGAVKGALNQSRTAMETESEKKWGGFQSSKPSWWGHYREKKEAEAKKIDPVPAEPEQVAELGPKGIIEVKEELNAHEEMAQIVPGPAATKVSTEPDTAMLKDMVTRLVRAEVAKVVGELHAGIQQSPNLLGDATTIQPTLEDRYPSDALNVSSATGQAVYQTVSQLTGAKASEQSQVPEKAEISLSGQSSAHQGDPITPAAVPLPSAISPVPSPQQGDDQGSRPLLEELFPELARSTEGVNQPSPPGEREVPRLPLVMPSKVKGSMVSTSKSEQIHNAFVKRGEDIWVLQLRNASPNLSEEDFQLLVPRGVHISDWKTENGFEKVIPKRDPISLDRLDTYYILFRSHDAALAYQANASKLYKFAKAYTPKSLQSPVPYPPGYLLDGEDIHAAIQTFTIKHPSQNIALTMKLQPYPSDLRRLLALGGYSAIVADQTYRPYKVLLRIDAGPDNQPGLAALQAAIIRDSLVGDRPVWRLASRRHDSILPLRDATVPDGRFDDERKYKTDGRWIISFVNRRDADRFARAWHGKVLHGIAGRKRSEGILFEGGRIDLPPPVAWTELLW